MVNQKMCTSWGDFETKIWSLLERVKEKRSKVKPLTISEPLFRGLADPSWGLKTTLERYSTKECRRRDYFRIIRSVRPKLQSLTGKSWDLAEEFGEDGSGYRPPEGYEFMIYLRHHGFPSPLLDWTLSPYVAAFFAFRSKVACRAENVAIYAFMEYVGGAKILTDDPGVGVIGNYVTTDRRHHIQQCEYTFCRKKVGDDFVYCDHESAFEQKKVTPQDSLIKFLIPTTERSTVMEKLHYMNINAYSLFGDEEGLMEELAYQEIESRE